MNICFEMAVNALDVSLIISFLIQYFGYKAATPVKYWGTALIWLLSFSVLVFFSWSYLYETYASALQILINILFCFTLLRGSAFQKMFMSAFIMGLMAIIATFTTLLMAKLSGNQITFLLGQFSGIRIATVFVAKLLFFMITRIILHVKEIGKIKWIDFVPLVIIPALSMITITLMMYAAMQEPRIQMIVLYAVCIVLLLNILIYFLFVRLGQTSRMQAEMELLALQNECLQENAKDIESMYETVRSLRHDLQNHLLCISAMAEEQKVDSIVRYTNQLLQRQNDVNKLIVFSGNQVLDAIVNSKSTSAERMGVHVRAIITSSLSDVPPEDITIIIGNALDNAIRAAKDSAGKTVELHIQPQGVYNSIMISNDVANPVLSGNPTLRTTKAMQQRHGFGVKNMRRAVDHNQGMIRFYEQNNRFICDILLLNLQSKNE